jgi:hypothetical protein
MFIIKIRIGKVKTDPVFVNSGLRQGDLMSPNLFNLVLEKVKETNIGPQEGMPLQGSPIVLLAYVDNLVLIDKSQDGLEHYATAWRRQQRRLAYK